MRLTRADFKDALRDSRKDMEFEIRSACAERKTFGAVTDHTQDRAILESAKVAALRYYLKQTKTKGTP